MLFYDKDTQRARFWTFDTQGQLDTNLVDATWNTWDIIVPFDTDNDGDDELLFYNADGTANIWDVGADGSIRLLSQASGWSTIWDIIIPVETHSNTDLVLFYDKDTQRARFWTFDTQGQLDTNLVDATWNAWDIIVPFDTDNDGDDELLFYNADGTGNVWDVGADGSIRLLSQSSGWSTIWDIIVPVETSVGILMLFYDKDTQRARFWTFDTQGQLDTNLVDETWNAWDVIAPIDPDNDGQDELLYYSLQDNSNNSTLTHALTSDVFYTVTFEIDRLRVVDGEEDGTFASSGSDEFYMLYFLSAYEDYVPIDEVGRGWGVYEVRAGDEFMYTTSGRGQYLRPLSLNISENTRFGITVLMLESENDDAARRLIQQVTNSDRIMMTDVENRFRDDQLTDSMIDALSDIVDEIDYWIFGEHDLLGVSGIRYYLPTDIAGGLMSGEFIVTGNNLGDAYDYRLEYTITVEPSS